MILINLGYLIDLIIGDPKRITHPTIVIGKMITISENHFLSKLKSKKIQILGGVALAAIIPGISFVFVYYLLKIAINFNMHLYIFLSAWYISVSIGGKELYIEGLKIYKLLKKNNIEKARESLSQIVGRDTTKMTETEIIRATIETISENLVDGIISPIIYATIGGAPLAIAYRAVNTLDSMVGHKTKKYINIGWASARLDDILNLIPARISCFLIILSSLLLKFNYIRSIKSVLKDSKKDSSPNSGYPEAAVAGALGIQLGGINYYNGMPVEKPFLGEKIKDINPADIINTIKIVFYSSLIMILLINVGWLVWG